MLYLDIIPPDVLREIISCLDISDNFISLSEVSKLMKDYPKQFLGHFDEIKTDKLGFLSRIVFSMFPDMTFHGKYSTFVRPLQYIAEPFTFGTWRPIMDKYYIQGNIVKVTKYFDCFNNEAQTFLKTYAKSGIQQLKSLIANYEQDEVISFEVTGYKEKNDINYFISVKRNLVNKSSEYVETVSKWTQLPTSEQNKTIYKNRRDYS